MPFEWAGKDMHGCPRMQVDAGARAWLFLHHHYRNGFLWRGGGLAEQPYRYLQAMTIVDDEIAAYEKERETERKQQPAPPPKRQVVGV